MLKQLIQLFAEKFLVSKKESVQDWTYPSIANRIAIQFSSTEDDIIYTPQATDGCRCTLGTRERLTSQLILTQRIIAQSCLAFCLLRPVGTATFIEYVKALMSRSQFQILYRKDGLCFFRLINSAVGGASC